jgi:hypothetical protein
MRRNDLAAELAQKECNCKTHERKLHVVGQRGSDEVAPRFDGRTAKKKKISHRLHTAAAEVSGHADGHGMHTAFD